MVSLSLFFTLNDAKNDRSPSKLVSGRVRKMLRAYKHTGFQKMTSLTSHSKFKPKLTMKKDKPKNENESKMVHFRAS